MLPSYFVLNRHNSFLPNPIKMILNPPCQMPSSKMEGPKWIEKLQQPSIVRRIQKLRWTLSTSIISPARIAEYSPQLEVLIIRIDKNSWRYFASVNLNILAAENIWNSCFGGRIIQKIPLIRSDVSSDKKERSGARKGDIFANRKPALTSLNLVLFFLS